MFMLQHSVVVHPWRQLFVELGAIVPVGGPSMLFLAGIEPDRGYRDPSVGVMARSAIGWAF